MLGQTAQRCWWKVPIPCFFSPHDAGCVLWLALDQERLRSWLPPTTSRSLPSTTSTRRSSGSHLFNKQRMAHASQWVISSTESPKQSQPLDSLILNSQWEIPYLWTSLDSFLAVFFWGSLTNSKNAVVLLAQVSGLDHDPGLDFQPETWDDDPTWHSFQGLEATNHCKYYTYPGQVWAMLMYSELYLPKK